MASQADNSIQFTFEGTNSISEADLQTAVANPGNPDYEAPVQDKPHSEVQVQPTTPVVETPILDTDKSAQPPTEELKTYTIKVNGEEMTVTEADLKAGHMRHRDYTQKTQQIAAEKAAWETERAQYQSDLQAINQFLRDKNAIATYTKQTFGVDLAAPPTPLPQLENPEMPTLADMAKISAYNTEQARIALAREFEEKLQAQAVTARNEAQQVARNIQQEKLGSELNSHVAGLLTKHPLLSKFDDIEEDLMGDASKRLRPGATLAEAKAEITAAAERRMAVIQSLVTEDKKAAAVSAAKLKQNSPEPPGGSPAKSPSGRKLTLNTSDKKDFLAENVAMLQAFQDANS